MRIGFTVSISIVENRILTLPQPSNLSPRSTFHVSINEQAECVNSSQSLWIHIYTGTGRFVKAPLPGALEEGVHHGDDTYRTQTVSVVVLYV